MEESSGEIIKITTAYIVVKEKCENDGIGSVLLAGRLLLSLMGQHIVPWF